MSQPKNNARAGQTLKPLIYLVDDEPLLLDLGEATLQADYRIKKFGDPEKALSYFLKQSTKPVLVISDYAMGKMNGVDLLARCKQAHPALKTMLASGTAGAEIMLAAPIKVDRFLEKPYQPEMLVRIVRELVGQ